MVLSKRSLKLDVMANLNAPRNTKKEKFIALWTNARQIFSPALWFSSVWLSFSSVIVYTSEKLFVSMKVLRKSPEPFSLAFPLSLSQRILMTIEGQILIFSWLKSIWMFPSHKALYMAKFRSFSRNKKISGRFLYLCDIKVPNVSDGIFYFFSSTFIPDWFSDYIIIVSEEKSRDIDNSLHR